MDLIHGLFAQMNFHELFAGIQALTWQQVVMLLTGAGLPSKDDH